jgi:hypothetical protein
MRATERERDRSKFNGNEWTHDEGMYERLKRRTAVVSRLSNSITCTRYLLLRPAQTCVLPRVIVWVKILISGNKPVR